MQEEPSLAAVREQSLDIDARPWAAGFAAAWSKKAQKLGLLEGLLLVHALGCLKCILCITVVYQHDCGMGIAWAQVGAWDMAAVLMGSLEAAGIRFIEHAGVARALCLSIAREVAPLHARLFPRGVRGPGVAGQQVPSLHLDAVCAEQLGGSSNVLRPWQEVEDVELSEEELLDKLRIVGLHLFHDPALLVQVARLLRHTIMVHSHPPEQQSPADQPAARLALAKA